MKTKIESVLNEMTSELTAVQLRKLQSVLLKTFSENESNHNGQKNEEYLQSFLDAKRIEGCSSRTIKYYQVTAEHMLSTINIPIRKITTEDLRDYLAEYQKINNCSKVTIDNVRRNLSSFFPGLKRKITL